METALKHDFFLSSVFERTICCIGLCQGIVVGLMVVTVKDRVDAFELFAFVELVDSKLNDLLGSVPYSDGIVLISALGSRFSLRIASK